MVESRRLLELFEAVAANQKTALEALNAFQEGQLDELVTHRADLTRSARNGFPEVIFGEGKKIPVLLKIVEDLLQVDARILVTRASTEQAEAVRGRWPELEWHEDARVLRTKPEVRLSAKVVVLAAGTTDCGVAEEAALSAEMFGLPVQRLYDVGVAGLHRLLAHRETLQAADAVIVVAGMEGALPSVTAGLISGPLIAVPTSVGYGASMGGLAALLGMLGSCAPGVVVVNIDNGFGAGFAAGRILAHRSAQNTVSPTATPTDQRTVDARSVEAGEGPSHP